MAIKKTALLLDQELVAQVKELLGTTTTTETITEAMREVIRVQGRARHFERLRRPGATSCDVIATHLADASAWAQLHRNDVAARLVPLLVGGRRRHLRDRRPRGPRQPSTTRASAPRPLAERPTVPAGARATTPCSTGPSRCRAWLAGDRVAVDRAASWRRPPSGPGWCSCTTTTTSTASPRSPASPIGVGAA